MRWLFWKTRLPLKLFWRYAGRSWRLIEFCKVCGRRNHPLVWDAPDSLWLVVNGSESGVLCPECFTRAAKAKGHWLRWTCYGKNGERLLELEKWCKELVYQPFNSREWGEAMDAIGYIITEDETDDGHESIHHYRGVRDVEGFEKGK